MPLINLIQEQRIEARARERKVQISLLATLGIGALCLVATGGLMLDAARLNMRAYALEQKQKEMKPLVEELAANTEEIERLQPRIQTLEEATDTTERWARILEYLTTNTPPDAWLNSVKGFQQDRTKPLVVTLNGVGLSQVAVGDLLLRIQANPEFESASLKFTQPKYALSGQKQFEFEIEASLANTAEVDDAPVEGDS